MAENAINSFNVDGSEYDVEDTAARARAKEAYDLAYAVNKTVNEPEPTWLSHRNIYRGKNLGNIITQDQLKHIKDGTFEDLYVGDYWEDTSQNLTWMIADMNYWTYGNSIVGKNHIVVIPKEPLMAAHMNNADSVTGGYVNSTMQTETIPLCENIVNNFFGSENVIPHMQDLSNNFNTTSGIVSSTSAVDIQLEIPDLIAIFGNSRNNTFTGLYGNLTRNIGQLSALKLNPKDIYIDASKTSGLTNNIYWLRNIASSKSYFRVYDGSVTISGDAYTATSGVRPIFAVG